MELSPVMYKYPSDKFPDIYNDYQNIKSKLSDDSSVVFEGVPIYGRVNSLPEKLKESDYTPAMGLVTLAVMNGPEDINDVMSAYKQIKTRFKQKPITFHSGYDNRYAQHPFSFFRGTVLHKYLNPLSEDCPNPKAAAWLIKHDKCLWDTKIGEWFKKVFNTEVEKTQTKIEKICSTDDNKKFVYAKKFKTNNPFKDITARALTRTSALGALALGGIEAAHIAHEVSNGKNFFEESKKSAVTLGATLGATGVLGALGAKYIGPTGSLLGMSAGAVVGAAVNKIMD